MAYDKNLEKRLISILDQRKGFYSQKMFGGVGFLLKGNMCIGVWKEFLILRLGEEEAEKALKVKHTKPFDITGRAMKGWVMVRPDGLKTQRSLKSWTEKAINFVNRLPRK